MKILHVISSMDPRNGGTSEAVRLLAAEGRRLGHHVGVATIDDPANERLQGLPIQALGPGQGSYQFCRPFAHWLVENVGRHDVVISHGLWQFTGLAVRWACRGRPYVVFPHGMLDPWFNQFALKRLKKSFYWSLFEGRVVRDAKAVFFTSEEEKLAARRSFSPYAAKETVVPLGIEEPPPATPAMAAAFSQKCPGVAGRPYFLFLGRLDPKKGCDLLLRAFAAWKGDAVLVMAGPNQVGWMPELQRLATELGVAERVFWPEMLADEAKWGALRGAEAFVLPSHQENFGIAVAEALACGTPVLISNKVNIWREIVTTGGGLAEDDTVEGTLKLLQNASSLRRENARACYERHFQLVAAAELFHARLAELIR